MSTQPTQRSKKTSMHIVIDLQGAQGNSRQRGMGRYSEALALALSRIATPQHRVTLLLNGAFTETIEPIRSAFAVLPVPPGIQIWQPLSPTHAIDPKNQWRRNASEKLFEASLKKLAPDVLLVTSLFEGHVDHSITSIQPGPGMPPTAVVLYDLIPLISPDIYLTDPVYSAYYHNRLAHLRRADMLLAISESTRNEGLDYLNLPSSSVVTISSAADQRFKILDLDKDQTTTLKNKYQITRAFVMYSGAIDTRKNVEGLVTSYAALPKSLRSQHQLVIVYDVSEHDRNRLTDLAARKGLAEGELVFTGFVPDDDLVALYNICALFVFPSLHEGFGLPALEAMTCGAPTIAANLTSLPEVIGWDEALFDPLDPAALTRALNRGLTDNNFRMALKRHAAIQCKKFSWEETARRTLAALENLCTQSRVTAPQPPALTAQRRPRLAYVSPLQGAQSGISDYSAELLPELATHYDIDVIVDQSEPVTDPWVLANARQRTVAWFETHSQNYDRVLYHFGNSHFHQHMFGLIERHPGIVVLHDFFLSGILAWGHWAPHEAGVFERALLHSHGWDALQDRFQSDNADDAIYSYPCNLAVLQRSLGVIVHSPYSCRLAAKWYGVGFADKWAIIPHLRVPAPRFDRARARAELRLGDDVFLACAFGIMHKTKLNHRLIEAWQHSSLGRDPRCLLVFVGQAPGGEYGAEIESLVRASNGRILITGWAEEAVYRRYLAAADMGVQLRPLSRGETSAAVLDCMNYGLATLVNANGSMADLPHEALEILPDEFSDVEMVAALERLYSDPALRKTLGNRAQAHIHKQHQPQSCAAQYRDSIEAFYAKAEQGALGLLKDIQPLGLPENPQDMLSLAERVAEIYPPKRPDYRQLLVDVSELANHDAKTGIQRVGRSVLHQLLEHPPEGFRVEPVFASMEHGYRYARQFTARFLGLGDVALTDEVVDVAAGDVFWGVDLQTHIVPQHSQVLRKWQHRGVQIFFTVYDLLPLLLPEVFSPGVMESHRNWMNTLAKVDGLIAISKTVMDDVADWLNNFGPQQGQKVKLGWATLGADVVKAVEGHTPHSQAQEYQLTAIKQFPAFLTVGTVEPRKGHAQVLAAFELLWSQGVQVNLVIVGKQGWSTEALVEKLRNHPLRERHLFWLEGISDKYLEDVYAGSTCLIAASTNEGFGLPLVEAGMHGLPILARDIPVFREVGGAYASYFNGYAPRDLAVAITNWLELSSKGKIAESKGMPWLTWEQSTLGMLDVLLDNKWQSEWTPKKDKSLVVRYWGSDDRLGSTAGKPEGRARVSTGQAGHLLYGPYITLKPGAYVAEVRGKIGTLGAAGALVDVCVGGAEKILAEQRLGDVQIEANILARLPFVLKKSENGFEVRVEVNEHSDVSVEEIVIRRAETLQEKPAIMNGVKAEKAQGFKYWATHPKLYSNVGSAVGRVIYSTGREGYLVFGPYVGLPAGRYEIKITGVLYGNKMSHDAYIDVSRDAGKNILKKAKILTGKEDKTLLGHIAFHLESFAGDVEARLHVGAADDVRVDTLEIIDITSRGDSRALKTRPLEMMKE